MGFAKNSDTLVMSESQEPCRITRKKAFSSSCCWRATDTSSPGGGNIRGFMMRMVGGASGFEFAK
jgi:hypothetical protein